MSCHRSSCSLASGPPRLVSLRFGRDLARIALLVACCGVGGGCGEWSLRAGSLFPQRASPHEVGKNTPPAAPPPAFAPADRRSTVQSAVALEFDILRVELPVDRIHHVRKVWNHTDQLRLEPGLMALLVRNGLRVGAAPADAWPALRAIFEAGDARIGDHRQAIQLNPPLTVELGAITRPESLCWYRRDGRLVGRTLQAGDRLLQMGYSHHPELGGCTDVVLGFEVRREGGSMVWEKRGSAIVQVPEYDRQLFEDLTAAFTLNPGEFLVIGPSEEAEDNEYLVGGRFFGFTRGGRRFDVILCITPRPVVSRAAGR